MVPTGKKVPEAGVAVIAPQSPSASPLSKVTRAPACPFCVVSANAVTFAGQETEQVAEPPLAETTLTPASDELLSACWSVVPLLILAVVVMNDVGAPLSTV